LNTQDKKGILRLFAAFGGSAAMLTLAQAPVGIWPLAWVAYVPFILACSSTRNTLAPPSQNTQIAKKVPPSGTAPDTFFSPDTFFLYLVAYVVGAIYWLGNLYWIGFVTGAGWVSFCLYTGLLWPILAICIRWCRQKKIPLIIAIPILAVGIEQSQGFLLGGFYWHYLAHSQYTNNSIIQIADIFGAAGVSFLVGMVNGLIAEIIVSTRNKTGGVPPPQSGTCAALQSNPPINWGAKFIQTVIVGAAVIGAFYYGQWRIGQAGQYVKDGPMVGAVQTNVPQSVKQTFAAEEQIFNTLINNNKQCVEAGAKLVVWPETMVQAILDPQVLRLIDESHTYSQFNKTIGEQAKQGAYILVGAYGGNPRIEENFDIRMAQKYNSAFLYTPEGNQSPEKYAKIHLVPFGEYIPFENVPLIYNLLMKFSPYDFDYTLDAGRDYTVFDMNEAGRFGVMICYEDAVPYVVRKFVLDKQGNKQIDWLVNISNDGWFVRFKNEKVITSTELAQHTVVCSLRAVENRTAVVRSVNTGISCVIDSLGRIRDGYAAGNLPKRSFDRRGVEGWFADIVPIDSRITIFSRYGQWLDLSCQTGLGIIILAILLERFIFRKRKDRK